MISPVPIVVALAGRRIDADSAEVTRFPSDNIGRVRKGLNETFNSIGASVLVCSAACGADLLALQIANERGMKFCVVLPYNEADFKRTSVVDRPGIWGPQYESLLLLARDNGALKILSGKVGKVESFIAANDAIVFEANRIASPHKATAVVVWEGAERGEGDLTEDFRSKAHRAGMTVNEVKTRY